MPVGQWYYPWAIRKDLTDFVKCAAGAVLGGSANLIAAT